MTSLRLIRLILWQPWCSQSGRLLPYPWSPRKTTRQLGKGLEILRESRISESVSLEDPRVLRTGPCTQLALTSVCACWIAWLALQECWNSPSKYRLYRLFLSLRTKPLIALIWSTTQNHFLVESASSCYDGLRHGYDGSIRVLSTKEKTNKSFYLQYVLAIWNAFCFVLNNVLSRLGLQTEWPEVDKD